MQLHKLNLLEFIGPAFTAAGKELQAAIGTYSLYTSIKLSLCITELMVPFAAVQTAAVKIIYAGPLAGGIKFHITDETGNYVVKQGIPVIIPAGNVLE